MKPRSLLARVAAALVLAGTVLVVTQQPAAAIVPHDAGFYEIRSRASNMCLDVYGFGTADGDPVVQWTCNGAANQQWRPEFVTFCGADRGIAHERPCYVFRNKHSGKCLDVMWGNSAVGTKVWQWRCDAGNAQIWTPFPRSAEKLEYQLISGLSDLWTNRFRCLDVPYVSKDRGVQQWIYSCNATIAQTWYLYAFRR
jgi:hypothetical protein